MEYQELQRIYARDEYYWGTEANEFARRALEYAPTRSDLTVVDVGAGEGRDSVFFAEQGLDALAVDVAPNGLEKARRLADERGVAIRTAVGDINDLRLEPVDLVYSIGAIQYRRPENRPEQFAGFKERTKPGGVHALFAFVDHPDVPPAPDWGDNEHFYDRDELADYYDDWQLRHAEAFVFDDDSSGEPHQHAATEIVYRKPAEP